MRLILASASPRRADLLREAGFDFDVQPAHVDESELTGESPAEYVLRVARLKARAVAALHPALVVLAADTTVVAGTAMLAKPADDDEAKAMLARLSGRTHEVLTGIVVSRNGREACEVVTSRVRFRDLTAGEIDWYVASGEPHDKAGAYGVQGLASRFVVSVEGSYSNVVGLPVDEACRLLAAEGIRPAGRDGRRNGAPPEPFDQGGG